MTILLAQGASGAGLTGVAAWVTDVMDSLGVVGAGLLIALENLFPPLPSEAILPLAGFAAARGSMNLFGALIATTIGSVVGALALYWLGYAFGFDRLRRIADKMPLVNVADVDRTREWFERNGSKAVFFGRMIPIFRSLISIPAGAAKMPLGKFLLFTTAGSAIWNTIFIMAGYLLGNNWFIVEEYAGVFQKIVIVVVALALLYWLFRRIQSIRAKSRERQTASEAPIEPDASESRSNRPEGGASDPRGGADSLLD